MVFVYYTVLTVKLIRSRDSVWSSVMYILKGWPVTDRFIFLESQSIATGGL